MCCADINLQNNAGLTNNINRCMNKDTVKYGYGVTISGNVGVLFECMSSAFFIKVGSLVAATSFAVIYMI